MDPYREYQDYVIAHRLRVVLGYVPGKCYSLPEYAALRLRRGELVRKLVARQGDSALLSRIEQITEDLSYGFWSNPSVLKGFMRRLSPVVCPVLESPQTFETLLTPNELTRLEPGLAGQYYLGWFRLPGLLNEPVAFEEALRQQEALSERLGLFLDEFHQVVG